MTLKQPLPPAFFRRWFAALLAFLACAAGLAPAARADVTASVVSLSITNYTGYIIPSDTNQSGAQFNRDHIAVEVSMDYGRLVSARQTNYVFDYVLYFELVDSNGVAQPLWVNGTTNTEVSTSYVVNRSNPIGLYFPVVSDVNLTPLGPLDPYAKYSVQLNVYRRLAGSILRPTFTGVSSTTAPQQYMTFADTDPNSTANDVIAELVAGANAQKYMINQSPTEGTFEVNVLSGLFSYHHWLASQFSYSVDVRMTLQLIDTNTMQTIPITQSQWNFTKTIQNVVPPSGPGQAPTPSVFGSIDTLKFAPAPGTQLDPTSGDQYMAIVTISHFESPSDLFAEPGNQISTPAEQFIQLSGNLQFGDIATVFTDVDPANPPTPGTLDRAGLQTVLAVDKQSGHLAGKTDHTYGDGTALTVELDSNGNAFLLSGNENMTVPTPDLDVIGNVIFDRGAPNLSTNGAIGALGAFLPTGFGYSFSMTNRILDTLIIFPTVKFTQALYPSTNLTSAFGITVYGCEETKPVWIPFTGLQWLVQQGVFNLTATGSAYCVRAEEYSTLEGLGLAVSQRPDNTRYYEFVSGVSGPVVVRADANGTALLTANFQIGPGQFTPHFPHNSGITWNGAGQQVVVDDLVDATQSGLPTANPVAVDYARDCADIACGSGIGPTTLVFQAATNYFAFTPDGGLQAAGVLEVPSPLQWGWIVSQSDYAQKTFDSFTNANFLMPGIFLRGGDSTDPATMRPTTLLFTGVLPTDLTQLERPNTTAYDNGFADYGGLNFRVNATGIRGASVLAGKPVGPYNLADFSKYYVRASGVSGIHQAKNDGSFPKNIKLYGYQFTFSNYGLSYLSQINVDSRTDGSVYVPAPSDFTQDLQNLKVTCLGALNGAEVPPNEVALKKILSYWNADFITDAISFDRKADQQCDPGDGVLELGVEAYAQHIATNIVGTLGFWPNGQIITLADCQKPTGPLDPPFDSRLKLPNSFKLAGPNSEQYNATPVNDAYLNNYADAPAGPGWVNVAAKLDVPFFDDMKVHLHTSPSLEQTNASVYVMGGWPDKGFGTSAHNFFTENPYDVGNRGFPTDPGITPAKYEQGLDAPDDHYRPRAQRSWLGGALKFDYPLTWSPTSHAFTSFKPVTENVVVLSMTHQITYLSAQRADIKFGAQFSLSPTADLANLAFDQLGGLETAFDKVISTQVIDKGLNGLNDMLDADLHKLFSGALDAAINPVIDALYTDLASHYDNASKQLQAGFDYPTLIANHLFGGVNTIETQFQQIAGAGAAGLGIANEVAGRLSDAINAIDEVKKLLAKDADGNRSEALSLVQDIASTASSLLNAPDLSDKINEFLQQADPTLNDISTVLGDLEKTLSDAQKAVAQGLGVATEIQTKINAATAQVHTAVTQIETEFNNLFASFKPGLDDPFSSMTPDQLKAMLRQKVEDKLYASVIGDIVHHALQQQFYDLNSSIREGLDTVMAQINEVIHGLLSEVLTGLSDELTNFTGGSGGIPEGIAAGGQIDGYAHIVGDSLSELRVDFKADLKVPAEMKFKAYFQIRELTSANTPAGCLPAGGNATEVKIGADDVEVDWIDPEMRANVMAKFSFQNSPFMPIGFAAGFELNGPLNFDAFTINQLGAQMGFGEIENYFSGDVSLEFNGYQGKGGIFFGKTCSPDPFFWDKDVQSLITTFPFTGVYVYGEIWIPVSEALLGIPATCFFEVSAGVGAGAGFAVEGPTYIGKMYLGISGSLLCILSVEGDVHLVAIKNAQGLALKGGGDLSASLGPCPFCITFSKSFGLTYLHGSWSVDF